MVALDIDLHHYPADDHDDIHDDADDSHMVAMVIDLHHYPAADDDDDYDFHDDADDSHIVYDSDMATSGRAAAMVAWSGLIQSSASKYTSYSAFPISSPIAWILIVIRISTVPTENLDCEDHLDSELLILRTNFGGHPPHIESHHSHRNHRLKNNHSEYHQFPNSGGHFT